MTKKAQPPAPVPPATPPRLLALRAAIDHVDDKLHALLRERADLIAQVPGVKGPQALYIRPGREAIMMKALLAREQGRLPPGLIGRLWREMIGTFTLQEGGMKIAVAAPPGKSDLWDMARDYYGSFTPLTPRHDAAAAFRDLAAGKVHIAVLPLPGGAADWWTGLAKHPDLRVFARLPFDMSDAARCNWRGAKNGALAVARIDAEPTGTDHSLIVVRLGKNTTRAALKTVCARHGLKIIAIHAALPQHMLMIVEGFMDRDAPLLAELRAMGCRAHCCGGYALPVAL